MDKFINIEKINESNKNDEQKLIDSIKKYLDSSSGDKIINLNNFNNYAYKADSDIELEYENKKLIKEEKLNIAPPTEVFRFGPKP